MRNSSKEEEFYDEVEIKEIDFSDSDFLGEDNKRSNKNRKRLRIFLIVLLILLLAAYAFGVYFYRTHFYPGTNVDGIGVSNCTDESAQIKINNTTSSREVTITGSDDLSSTITANEIGLKFDDLEILKNILNNQNSFIWPIDIFRTSDHDFTTDYTYNQDLLNNIVNNLPLVTNPNIVAPVNAQIEYNGDKYSIKPSVAGDQPNIDKLKEAIVNALLHNISDLNLEKDNLNNKPSITENDPSIKNEVEDLNNIIQADITINFPGEPMVLNKDTFHSWLSVSNGKVVLSDDDLRTYVEGLANQFDTQGKDYSFRTHAGQYISLRLNNGYVLNQQQMVDTLREQILKGEDQTEDPIWSQSSGNYISGDQIDTNYVEVSLQTQHIWLFNNNNEITSSSIVSGDVSKGEQTVTGLFFVQSKSTGDIMNVELPNGTRSDERVNYYISYGNNSGIVAAPWRTSFGNNIYMNQGTSGFIAVPNDTAEIIYNTVSNNYPIVIY